MDTGDAKADALSWVIQPFAAFARGRNLIQSPRLFRFSSGILVSYKSSAFTVRKQIVNCGFTK